MHGQNHIKFVWEDINLWNVSVFLSITCHPARSVKVEIDDFKFVSLLCLRIDPTVTYFDSQWPIFRMTFT